MYNSTGSAAVLWLGAPECHDPLLAGGKAAGLSRLAAAWPVPPGFCLTVPALSRRRWDRDPAAGVPPNIRDLLEGAYALLGDRCGTPAPRVAVRSSAANEDGCAVSFAGQYTTFLNVAGTDALAEAVARSRASAFSARVAAYHRNRQEAGGDARIAVLVQQLIPADISLVAFSVHPITGSDQEIVINANWGLGESIVGGRTTPDTFVVAKADLRIVQRRIGAKKQMTVPAPTGTRDVPAPRALRVRPALNDMQIAASARMVRELERETGGGVDVECAWKGDGLHLLQCRPVTALDRLSGRYTKKP